LNHWGTRSQLALRDGPREGKGGGRGMKGREGEEWERKEGDREERMV